MIDKAKLRGAIRSLGLTLKEFCHEIGMSQSSFIRKEKNDSFGIDEVYRIVKVLGLTRDHAVEIFFANELT